MREIVEEVAFQAREDKRIDRRSGVSQRLPISALENVLSSAEQRAVRSRDSAVVARVADVYAAIPGHDRENSSSNTKAKCAARKISRGS